MLTKKENKQVAIKILEQVWKDFDQKVREEIDKSPVSEFLIKGEQDQDALDAKGWSVARILRIIGERWTDYMIPGDRLSTEPQPKSRDIISWAWHDLQNKLFALFYTTSLDKLLPKETREQAKEGLISIDDTIMRVEIELIKENELLKAEVVE